MEKTPTHRRKTIGVLINWTVDPYQQMFLDGVMDFARQSGMNCIIFEGGTLNAPQEYEAERNMVFPLASEKVVDGLVVLPASIGLFAGKEKMKAFCGRYGSIPLVSVAMDLEGIPSVLIDNRSGMRELVVHLIEEHACRRFAFIAGPTGIGDAEDRREVFEQVLREHGIAFDPRSLFQGDYSMLSGIDAAKYFLREGIQKFDVMVAANDGMASGALKELIRNKVRVPEQLAVTGFDNIDMAGYLSPSLTTVKQPIYEEGWTATKLIADLLAGRGVAQKTYLPTRLVVRESCKCVPLFVSALEGETPGSPLSRNVESGDGTQRFPYIQKIIQNQYSTVLRRDSAGPDRNLATERGEKSEPQDLSLLAKFPSEIAKDSRTEDLDFNAVRNMLCELWQNRTVSASGNSSAVRNEELIFRTIMKIGQQTFHKEWDQINGILQEHQILELIQELPS